MTLLCHLEYDSYDSQTLLVLVSVEVTCGDRMNEVHFHLMLHSIEFVLSQAVEVNMVGIVYVGTLAVNVS